MRVRIFCLNMKQAPLKKPVAPAGALRFTGLGITGKLEQAIAQAGFLTPTPIQHQAIPIAITGQDVMGIAQTGTGKTLAFGIPMVQRIGQNKTKGLVLVPTRELAVQVHESLQKVGTFIGLKTVVVIGGEPIPRQIKLIRQGFHILIATPGRLIDHMEQRTVKMEEFAITVLDEADRMLDMGFAPQINRILKALPKERQTMLFSATMPEEITAIARTYLKQPLRVEVAPPGTTAKRVTQEIFFVPRDGKLSLLENILKQYTGTILVFSRTKFGAKKISRVVNQLGIRAAEIHSNRSLNQRLDALNGFKKGTYRVLVATDIAARGIDVSGIEVVINYDLPATADDYVHRIGRTGRAGQEGHAISFAQPDQKSDVHAIERLIKQQLPVSPLPDIKFQPRTALPRREFSNPKYSTAQQPHRNRFQNNIPDNRRPSYTSPRPRRESFSNSPTPQSAHSRPYVKKTRGSKSFKKSFQQDTYIKPRKPGQVTDNPLWLTHIKHDE